MKNIKLNDDVKKLVSKKHIDIEQGIELQELINSRSEKKNKAKELASKNPELNSYFTLLGSSLDYAGFIIDEIYGILAILQNDLILKQNGNDKLSNEVNSIKGARSILDNLWEEISDTADSINDVIAKKED